MDEAHILFLKFSGVSKISPLFIHSFIYILCLEQKNKYLQKFYLQVQDAFIWL